jgi:hypothetical protein
VFLNLAPSYDLSTENEYDKLLWELGCYIFTPLESPSIYAGDGGNRKHQFLIEDGVKALPFLTGFT